MADAFNIAFPKESPTCEGRQFSTVCGARFCIQITTVFRRAGTKSLACQTCPCTDTIALFRVSSNKLHVSEIEGPWFQGSPKEDSEEGMPGGTMKGVAKI